MEAEFSSETTVVITVLHGIWSEKNELFIAIVMGTSDP
jgi:hypothetical protein